MTKDFNSGADDSLKETLVAGTDKETQAVAGKVSAFAALSVPNFRLLLTGSLFAYATQWIQSVILSWLVYDLTGSGVILGSFSLVSSAGSLCMILATGLLVDYFNRRKLMLIETGWMFAVTLTLALTLISGHSNMAFLFIFAFIGGLTQTLDSTLRQVMVFDLVPRSRTPGAMALVQTGWSLMRVAGPSLGGFLIIWFGPGGSFLVQAGAYALIIITIVQIKLPYREINRVRSSPLQNIREGLSYLLQERVTRIFTFIGIIMPILIIPIFATLPPIYAVKVYGDNSGRILGFLMASVGAGGIIGGIATIYLRRLEHWGRLQLASLFLTSLTLIAFTFTSNLIVALALLVLSGFFEIIFLTMNQTMIQLSIADELRGRVTAVINLTWILMPVGSLIAGAGADLFGGPKMITVILASAAALVVILIFMVSPTVRNYRLSQNIASKQA